jgi:hypothetical protein
MSKEQNDKQNAAEWLLDRLTEIHETAKAIITGLPRDTFEIHEISKDEFYSLGGKYCRRSMQSAFGVYVTSSFGT